MPKGTRTFAISQTLQLRFVQIRLENFFFHFCSRKTEKSKFLFENLCAHTSSFIGFIFAISSVTTDANVNQNVHCVRHVDVKIGRSRFLRRLTRQLTYESERDSKEKTGRTSLTDCRRCKVSVRDRVWLNQRANVRQCWKLRRDVRTSSWTYERRV